MDKESIKAEIERLKEMKPKVVKLSFFGDDNHATIDAQIYVLENELIEDKAYDNYKASDEHIREGAEVAGRWLESDECDEVDSPSKEWARLVKD